MQPQVICIGEVLFDVFGDVELLAGAPLNVSAHVRRLGHEVGFVSGVGTDTEGDLAMSGIEALDLPLRWVARVPGPTGRVQVEIYDGEPTYDIRRGVAYERIELPKENLSELAAASPAWVYYGTLAQSFAVTHETTKTICSLLSDAKCLYDLNLRTGFDSQDLIFQLLDTAHVVKLNYHELQRMLGICGWQQGSDEENCRRLAERFALEAVCVTRGERGAALLYESQYVEAETPQVDVVDTVGAGDAFAAALLHGLSEQWEPERIVRFGNALGGFVAGSHGAIPQMTSEQLSTLINT